VWYVVFSPINPNSETQSRDLQEVARKLALQLHTACQHRTRPRYGLCNRKLRAGALLIGGDAFFAQPERASCRTGGAACDSDDFLYA
jgi:hypothetical protein